MRSEAEVVDLSPGRVAGVTDAHTQTIAWLGIPYAQPPVGERRWRAPGSPEPWSGLRDGSQFGPACIQMGGIQGPGSDGRTYGVEIADDFGQPVGDEDCLYVNVWRPVRPADEPLPVVVFVHGGANVVGFSGDPLYHGAQLAARAQALVFSMNYRLGVFGWFMHPSLRTGEDPLAESGNLGLLDIIKALQFVSENAAAFGGDPSNITLMGQSAGAVNTYSLMVSPLAEGLFHKAVTLSGALFNSPIEARDAYAEAVLQRLPPEHRPASGVLGENLRAVPASELVAAAHGLEGGGLSAGDGLVIPVDIPSSVAAGEIWDGPLLTGITAEEGTFFTQAAFQVSEADRFRQMMGWRPGGSEEVDLNQLLKPEYASVDGYRALAQATTDQIFALIDGTLQLIAGRDSDIYAFRFDWAPRPKPWRTLIGASHAIELPFLFGNFGGNYFSPVFTPQDEPGRTALSATLVSMLAEFIRTGSPNGAGLPHWESWSQEQQNRLVLDATDDTLSITPSGGPR